MAKPTGKRRASRAYGVLKGHLSIGEVELPDQDEVSIVVVADTHSRPHQNGLAQIESKAPFRIIHGGDIGQLSVLDQLEQIAPVIAVRGNIDPMDVGLPAIQVIKWTRNGDVCSTWLLTHIAVRGPKLYPEIKDAAQHHGAQLVICGHSHVPFMGRDHDLAIFNPGSIGPRRFSLPITFGTIRMSSDGIDLTHINCETGGRLKIDG